MVLIGSCNGTEKIIIKFKTRYNFNSTQNRKNKSARKFKCLNLTPRSLVLNYKAVISLQQQITDFNQSKKS